LFAPVREGRRLVFNNLPVLPGENLNFSGAKIHKTVDRGKLGFYTLLFNYNVTCVGETILYKRKPDEELRRAVIVDFAIKNDAEHARLKFNEFKWHGNTLGVAPLQILRKFLGVSWDSGRAVGHFSGRD
jgi:hypothetical protein